MSKRIQTSNRKAHLKELLKTLDTYEILKDKIVLSWNVSRRQIERYLSEIRKDNNSLERMLKLKNDTRLSYRIPKELSIKLNQFHQKHIKQDKNLKKVDVLIAALMEYITNKG